MNISQLPLILACSLVVLAPLSRTAAQAKERDPDALIMRGLDLRRTGRSEEALILFRRAYEAEPSPRTLGQMGLVESSLQLWIDADTHLGAALATPDDAWVRRNRHFLDQAMDHAREHVGELAITGPPGTRISVAGKRAGTLPLVPLRLAEGEVDVSASADGRRPYSVQVSVKGGGRAAISIVLEPVELAAPDHEPQSLISPEPSATRTRACRHRAGSGRHPRPGLGDHLDRPQWARCLRRLPVELRHEDHGNDPRRRGGHAGIGRRRVALLRIPFRHSQFDNRAHDAFG
jgi:hypothetical protein